MAKNRYMGMWVEPESRVVVAAFTVANACTVVKAGLDPNSGYTHRDIAHWCERFWNAYCDVDAPKDIERIMPILADIETQWDLYLANTYKVEELQRVEFDVVRLPLELFEKWSKQLSAESASRGLI